MHPSHTGDSIDAFTLELLRSGYALTNLAYELTEAVEENPECDEDVTSVFEMISASIRTFLAEADPAEVDAATALMSGAMDRVLQHLQTVLEIRRHMEAGDPIGRGYDDPMLTLTEAPEPPALEGPAKPEPEDAGHELAIELVDCGPLLGGLIEDMAAWSASSQAPATATPFPEGAHNFMRVLIDEFDGRYSDQDLTTSAAILRDLGHAITHDVFILDPDFQDPDLN